MYLISCVLVESYIVSLNYNFYYNFILFLMYFLMGSCGFFFPYFAKFEFPRVLVNMEFLGFLV